MPYPEKGASYRRSCSRADGGGTYASDEDAAKALGFQGSAEAQAAANNAANLKDQLQPFMSSQGQEAAAMNGGLGQFSEMNKPYQNLPSAYQRLLQGE